MLVAVSAFERAAQAARGIGCREEDLVRAWQKIPPQTARVQMSAFGAFLDDLANVCHCDHFGLIAGLSYQPSDLGALGYLLSSCSTISEAVHKAWKYMDFHQQGVISQVKCVLDQLVITYYATGISRNHARRDAESAIASIIAVISNLAGYPVLPRSVNFAHNAPECSEVYKSMLQSNVNFGLESNFVIYDRSVLEFRIAKSDPYLLQYLEKIVRKGVDDLPRLTDIVGKMRWAVCQLLSSDRATLSRASKLCDMSIRTAQRRLFERGVTFATVRDEFRRELFEEIIAADEMGMRDIAYALGFNDTSALNKAIKRWNSDGDERGRPMSPETSKGFSRPFDE